MATSVTAALGERALEGYESHLRARGRSTGTVDKRVYYVRRMLRDLEMPPAMVTWAELETWLAAHTWAAATRASVVATLRSFFEWTVVAGIRPDNPAAGLHSPGQPPPCPKPMPEAALVAGLEASVGTEVWWLLRLLATTGLRRSEAAGLCSDDVSAGWIRVTGKGSKTRRVPVPPDVEAWIASRGGWVFPSPYGGHVTPDAITKRVERATGYPPHTLRHRYATRAYRASHDLRSVQRLLGHSSIATTERYIAGDDDELVAAASVTWAA